MRVIYRHTGEAVDYTPSAAVTAGDVIVQGERRQRRQEGVVRSDPTDKLAFPEDQCGVQHQRPEPLQHGVEGLEEQRGQQHVEEIEHHHGILNAAGMGEAPLAGLHEH